MILDFSLTLVFIHFILATYYSGSLPLSLFFWLVMAASAVIMIAFAEQLCVKREMREGLGPAVVPTRNSNEGDDVEAIELGERRD
jgi:protein SYS1